MKVSRWFLGLVAVLTATPVLAQKINTKLPGGAFIYCPQSPDFCASELNPLKYTLASEFVSPIIQASVMPSDLTPYSTIFMVLPTPLMNQSQINLLNKFRHRKDKPGRIVVMGDPAPLPNKTDVTFSGNDLLIKLGVPITMMAGVLPQDGDTCPVISENLMVDPLTREMNLFAYSNAGNLITAGGSKPLLAGNLGLGAIIGAVWPGYNRKNRNDVVVVFDGSIFGSTSGCSTQEANTLFWSNLVK